MLKELRFQPEMVVFWTISVGTCGMTQSFALVSTGILQEQLVADLTVFEGSLSTSILAPLKEIPS